MIRPERGPTIADKTLRDSLRFFSARRAFSRTPVCFRWLWFRGYTAGQRHDRPTKFISSTPPDVARHPNQSTKDSEEAYVSQSEFQSCALDLYVRDTIPVASKHLRYHVLPAHHMFQFQEILIELFRSDFQITPATEGRCAIFRSQSLSL